MDISKPLLRGKKLRFEKGKTPFSKKKKEKKEKRKKRKARHEGTFSV